MNTTWVEKPQLPENVATEFPEMHPIVLRMLWNRGMRTQEQIDTFLSPDYARDIHDPFLFRDMHKAVKRIMSAIQKSEPITVHGDYDADGVCASAILHIVLEKLGADVRVFLPDRMKDGYGLNPVTVERLATDGTKLIITCDCGISNKREVELAASLGVDVIITDHHSQPLELPTKAVAIIHPHVEGETYPFKGMAGGGVAWKLAHALMITDAGKTFSEGFEKWLLDLASISTVADVMSLTGENRTIVAYGLVVMKKTRWLGLRELLRTSRLDPQHVTATDIAFRLAPRINAAGRVDHSNMALELLLSRRPSDAVQHAARIEKANQERGKIAEVMVGEALEQIASQKDEKLLTAISDHWKVGLLGLVAGRLMDMFHKPVIIMTRQAEDVTGSGRSPGTLNLVQTLQSADSLLLKYGGHPPAAGFTVHASKYDAFLQHMYDVANKTISDDHPVKILEVEAEIPLQDVSWELYDELVKFEPCGAGNPEPLFVAKGVTVRECRPVGSNNQHGKIVVEQQGKVVSGIAFRQGEVVGALKPGQVVDIAFCMNVNEWNGNRELQCMIKDLHHD